MAALSAVTPNRCIEARAKTRACRDRITATAATTTCALGEYAVGKGVAVGSNVSGVVDIYRAAGPSNPTITTDRDTLPRVEAACRATVTTATTNTLGMDTTVVITLNGKRTAVFDLHLAGRALLGCAAPAAADGGDKTIRVAAGTTPARDALRKDRRAETADRFGVYDINLTASRLAAAGSTDGNYSNGPTGIAATTADALCQNPPGLHSSDLPAIVDVHFKSISTLPSCAAHRGEAAAETAVATAAADRLGENAGRVFAARLKTTMIFHAHGRTAGKACVSALTPGVTIAKDSQKGFAGFAARTAIGTNGSTDNGRRVVAARWVAVDDTTGCDVSEIFYHDGITGATITTCAVATFTTNTVGQHTNGSVRSQKNVTVVEHRCDAGVAAVVDSTAALVRVTTL